MNKSELINELATKHSHFSLSDVDSAVKIILERITQTLVHGDRIEIRGFGSFNLRYYAPRNGRNPRTGEAVAIPPKYKVHFKAGKELKERLNHSLNRIQ